MAEEVGGHENQNSSTIQGKQGRPSRGSLCARHDGRDQNDQNCEDLVQILYSHKQQAFSSTTAVLSSSSSSNNTNRYIIEEQMSTTP